MSRIAVRCISSLISGSAPRDFHLIPDFLSVAEQRVLLTAALQKLDASESRRFRLLKKGRQITESPHLQDIFHPDDHYQFDEGHFDGVIQHYREMHVTSWLEDGNPELSSLLDRIRKLYPSLATQTHLLHLASYGAILPHVDNVEASGSWILGVSLGAPRIMRMESVEDHFPSFDALLPSGSVYLQRDTVRYHYKHSILRGGSFNGRLVPEGQRVSVMIRDQLPTKF